MDGVSVRGRLPGSGPVAEHVTRPLLVGSLAHRGILLRGWGGGLERGSAPWRPSRAGAGMLHIQPSP